MTNSKFFHIIIYLFLVRSSSNITYTSFNCNDTNTPEIMIASRLDKSTPVRCTGEMEFVVEDPFKNSTVDSFQTLLSTINTNSESDGNSNVTSNIGNLKEQGTCSDLDNNKMNIELTDPFNSTSILAFDEHLAAFYSSLRPNQELQIPSPQPLHFLNDEILPLENSEYSIHDSPNLYFKEPVMIKNLQIFFDLSELLVRLIWFRIDFYQFSNEYFSQKYHPPKFDSKMDKIIQKFSGPDSSLFYFGYSKLIIKNLMLLIYITLDFAQKVELHYNSSRKYQTLTISISRHQVQLTILNNRLENGKDNEMIYSHLKNLIIQKQQLISSLKTARNELPPFPSIRIASRYVKFISNFKPEFAKFRFGWISIFCSLIKIYNLYDQKLKQSINDHLDKFKCPAHYKNREILRNENFYFDVNSFTFIVLDWIFYFFSSEFQEHFTNGNLTSKILSRLTVLIFILFNDPEMSKILLSNKRIFDEWILNLENEFKSSENTASSDNLLKEFYDKIKNFHGSISIRENAFALKIVRKHNLEISDNLEMIIYEYLSRAYEIGLSSYKAVTIRE